MGVSKVIINGTTKVDLTSDTVASNNLLSGNTAHGADGNAVSGSYVAPSCDIDSLTVTPSESEQVFDGTVYSPDDSYYTRNTFSSTSTESLSPSLTVGDTYYLLCEMYTNGGFTLWRTEEDYFECSSSLERVTDHVSASSTQVSFNNSLAVDWTIVKIYEVTTSILDGYKPVTVSAIPSDYVGSSIPRLGSLYYNGSTLVVGYSGYYSSNVTYSIPTGSAFTPATTITASPSISINSSTGLITAINSASQYVTPSVSRGYIASGTQGLITIDGSSTSQLSVQAAKTVTPTTSQQTAVAAGKYTTGDVVVSAMRLQSKTVTPGEQQQTISPDDGYDGLSSVVVGAGGQYPSANGVSF